MKHPCTTYLELKECPQCNQKSLIYSPGRKIYWCKRIECGFQSKLAQFDSRINFQEAGKSLEEFCKLIHQALQNLPEEKIEVKPKPVPNYFVGKHQVMIPIVVYSMTFLEYVRLWYFYG